MKTKNCSSKKKRQCGGINTPQQYHLLVRKHLRSNSTSNFKYLHDLRQTMLLPCYDSQLTSRALASSCLHKDVVSALHRYLQKAGQKGLKNQHCKKRQERCNQKPDSTGSVIHIPLFCVPSDFFPLLLIYWFAAGGEYWGLQKQAYF